MSASKNAPPPHGRPAATSDPLPGDGTPRKKPKAPRETRKKAGSAPAAGVLLEEIQKLRVTFHACLDHYRTRVDATLASAIARMEGSAGKADGPSGKLAKELLAEIHALGLKPEKGRAKDLARIKRVAEKAEKSFRKAS